MLILSQNYEEMSVLRIIVLHVIILCENDAGRIVHIRHKMVLDVCIQHISQYEI